MNALEQVLPLALLDTVSVSTLIIPLWILLVPRGLRYANVFGYLLLVATGYLLLGIALTSGLSAGRKQLRTAWESPSGEIAVTAVGVILILFALWYGLLRRNHGDAGNEPLQRWRESVAGESAAARGVITVAVIAILLETATMFPYLIAIEIVDRDVDALPARVLVLAVYCLVMVAPAIVLTIGRMLFGRTLTPALRWLNDDIRRNAREDTAWLVGICGFLLISITGGVERGVRLLDTW